MFGGRACRGGGGGSGNEDPKGETSSKDFCIVKSEKKMVDIFHGLYCECSHAQSKMLRE